MGSVFAPYISYHMVPSVCFFCYCHRYWSFDIWSFAPTGMTRPVKAFLICTVPKIVVFRWILAFPDPMRQPLPMLMWLMMSLFGVWSLPRCKKKQNKKSWLRQRIQEATAPLAAFQVDSHFPHRLIRTNAHLKTLARPQIDLTPSANYLYIFTLLPTQASSRATAGNWFRDVWVRVCMPELIVGPPPVAPLPEWYRYPLHWGTGVHTCQEPLRSSTTDTKSVHISSVVLSCQTQCKKKKNLFCVQEKQKWAVWRAVWCCGSAEVCKAGIKSLYGWKVDFQSHPMRKQPRLQWLIWVLKAIGHCFASQ